MKGMSKGKMPQLPARQLGNRAAAPPAAPCREEEEEETVEEPEVKWQFA